MNYSGSPSYQPTPHVRRLQRHPHGTTVFGQIPRSAEPPSLLGGHRSYGTPVPRPWFEALHSQTQLCSFICHYHPHIWHLHQQHLYAPEVPPPSLTDISVKLHLQDSNGAASQGRMEWSCYSSHISQENGHPCNMTPY